MSNVINLNSRRTNTLPNDLESLYALLQYHKSKVAYEEDLTRNTNSEDVERFAIRTECLRHAKEQLQRIKDKVDKVKQNPFNVDDELNKAAKRTKEQEAEERKKHNEKVTKLYRLKGK